MEKVIKKEFKTALSAQEIYGSVKEIYPGSGFLNSSYRLNGRRRQSYIGCDMFLKFTSRGRKSEIIGGTEVKKADGNPLAVLNGILKCNRIAVSPDNDFAAGGLGFFSYDLKNILEKLPETASDDLRVPDISFSFYKTILSFCESRPGVVTVFFLKPESGLEKRTSILKEVFSARSLNESCPPPVSAGKPLPNFTKAGYLAAVKKVKRYIVNGDIFQACISQRFAARFAGDPWLLYKKLDSINPAPYSAYLDFEGLKILSASPELFLKIKEGVIETKPMKGTINRGRGGVEDNLLKKKLLKSDKDAAELSMIVDLERNDLGKICEPGSVKVARHRDIEKYASVFQTTSTVKGLLSNPGMDVETIIRATFPGGSISGCPKIRAMEIIDEIEPTVRGVYTGSIGYISFHKTMCLNMAIRTMVCKNGAVYFQVGGGIVSDSIPEKEFKETLIKAKALIDSLS